MQENKYLSSYMHYLLVTVTLFHDKSFCFVSLSLCILLKIIIQYDVAIDAMLLHLTCIYSSVILSFTVNNICYLRHT